MTDAQNRQPIRVLVVDDHPMILEGTQALLRRSPNIEVVGAAMSGKAAVQMVEELQPEVLLLDVRLPDMNGVEVARAVRTTFPDVAVLVLTGYDDTGMLRSMLQLGVPGYLRKLRPDLRISFFHHTPFPAADMFNVLPWRRHIIGSLLACDVVGFHVPRYATNFVGVCRSLRNVDIQEVTEVEETMTPVGTAIAEPEIITRIGHRGRSVRIDAFPVGTNTDFIAEVLTRPETVARIADVEREINTDKLILSVGRVDYTKGTKEMLDAYDRLLARRKDLHGKVKLMVTSVAANQSMTVYRETQEEIEQIVGRIHGKYATLEWGPIMLFTTPIPFEELVAYFRASDICWTTPMRDGLNLVAKEYIAAHEGDGGCLVLSEFTGVAAELPDAVPTNPYSPDNMVAAIERAIAMPEDEQRERMKRMYANVVKYNITHWAEHTLETFRELRPAAAPLEPVPDAGPVAASDAF